MKTKEWFEREKYVALHAQSRRFRIIKYIVIISLSLIIGLLKGWILVLELLGCLFVLGITVHFVFRWKTKAWTQSWGPYKKMDLP